MKDVSQKKRLPQKERQGAVEHVLYIMEEGTVPACEHGRALVHALVWVHVHMYTATKFDSAIKLE